MPRTSLGLGLALILTIAGPSSVFAQAPPTDPIQQQFIQAMQALEAGRAAEAATLLSILAARTDAPRIRLELARALYFQGRLKEARAEFLKVYTRGDLPYAVRRTVNVFLSDIDQRAGYFEPSLSLTADSNPQLSPASGVYDIFGAPLDYKSDSKPATGLKIEASGAAPLGHGGFSVIGSAGVTGYADDDLGQVSLTGGVRRLDAGRSGWWGVNGGYFERRNYDPQTVLTLERVKRITAPDQGRQMVVRLAVNRVTVRHQDQLNGMGLEGGADYGFDLNPNAALSLSLSAGHAGARYAIDRRTYGGLGVGLTAALPRWNKTVTLRGSLSDSRYGGVDPFFGKRRDDRSFSAEARLLDGRPIHGLFPSLSVTWERRSSSIGFFDYERTGISAGLQRRF